MESGGGDEEDEGMKKEPADLDGCLCEAGF